MKPGRELDALVAEKVMGETRPRVWGTINAGIRPYSTSIEAAWQVVERIKSLHGRTFSVTFDGSGWVAGYDLGLEWGMGVPVGETAPHAIALAALKAVGVV